VKTDVQQDVEDAMLRETRGVCWWLKKILTDCAAENVWI